jgi:hypothetical protein
MEKKFKALRFVGTFYKVVGIIIGVITAIGSIGFCVMSVLGSSLIDTTLQNLSSSYGGGYTSGPTGLFGGILGGVIVGGVILLYGGITALTSYAAGELIYLFINMEENTRATVLLLQHRSDK